MHARWFARVRRVRVWLVGALCLGAFTAWGADEFIYTVQPGDHPWNLAQRYLKDPSYGQRLRRLNHIADDRHIAPGTRLRIPSEWLRLVSSSVRLLAVYADTAVLADGAPPRPAVAGEALPAGAVLRTGAQASATLEFDDGSHVLVHQNTELRLVQAQRVLLPGTRQVALELRRGTLENQVTPATAPTGRFEIRSPAAVAAVRGTVFRVSATPQQTRTEVLEGAVLVGNDAGQSSTAAGFGTVAAAGQAPGAPVVLLAAPDLAAVPGTVERFPAGLLFPPVAAAAAYHTQLSVNERFEVIVSDETSAAPLAVVRNVPDARYTLRVRSIDANGLEGPSAQRELEVHARPEPPLLIAPPPGADVLSARPRFQWTQAGTGRSYRLELRRAEDGAQAPALQVQTVTATDSAVAPQDLESGLYQWRVATVDVASGRPGPWGDSQGFRRVLPGPGVEPAQLAAGSMVLRWSAQPQTRSYHLQVARDAGFAELLTDTETPATQFQLNQLTPGPYYVRVSVSGQDGHAGPWGETQSLTVPVAEPPAPSRWPALLLLLPLLLGL